MTLATLSTFTLDVDASHRCHSSLDVRSLNPAIPYPLHCVGFDPFCQLALHRARRDRVTSLSSLLSSIESSAYSTWCPRTYLELSIYSPPNLIEESFEHSQQHLPRTTRSSNEPLLPPYQPPPRRRSSRSEAYSENKNLYSGLCELHPPGKGNSGQE